MYEYCIAIDSKRNNKKADGADDAILASGIMVI